MHWHILMFKSMIAQRISSGILSYGSLEIRPLFVHDFLLQLMLLQKAFSSTPACSSTFLELEILYKVYTLVFKKKNRLSA